MKSHGWLNSITDSPALDAVCQSLRAHRRAAARGGWGSSTTLLAGALALRLSQPVLLVTAHLDDADDALEDLALFDGAGMPLPCERFGALEVLPGESGVSLELLAERLAIVQKLVDHRGTITAAGGATGAVLIAPIQALMQPVPEPGALDEFSLTLETGKAMPPGRVLEWLDRAGYTRVDAIEQPGDFTTRGGIIDIYLPSAGGEETLAGPTPIRLDFFGDEIESINLVDTSTMGSGRPLRRMQVVGASVQKLTSDQRTTSLLKLIHPDTLVVLHETMELAEQARGYYERLVEARGVIQPNVLLQQLTQRRHVEINHYSPSAGGGETIELPVRSLQAFDQDASKAVIELGELSQTARVISLCQKPAEQQRMGELIREHAPAAVERIVTEVGYLHRGFVWDPTMLGGPGPAIYLTPHHEVFHRYQTRRRIRRLSVATERASDAFLDLEAGDYVVHIDHGIARFVGLKTMRGRDKDGSQDYLTLEFADKALLHVPAAQIELVQKYVGGFQGRPPLSVLGGKRWQKQKQQVQEAVKDLAAQMLQIQAARASLPGIRYPGDTPWQNEFEAEFPYDETDDQLAAIGEVKKDMADEQPMDRLICGDVGFGKTEIAIRAAFKAVEFGKQVAVLVPTTVLAEQHERTFRERMAQYPFRVESLSRFRTGAEQGLILGRLALGQVDIVIGTHRLLSQDVKFADLGLVIVDEEQRFGVEHKHKLLQFRLTADVLTLSATPIPRTLHMAMLGLRDISSLSTAPVDRRAIVTEVMPFDRQRVKRALARELARDGQVFFVHNRVHNIQQVADEVRKMAPDARIIIGHGQMSGHELEQVMLTFMRREADILVCTTIIESGIDIPTANTIIINQADSFGLAELHQLRGRVGRYKHRAYCYLLLPEDRPITEKATRRLKAIEQYSMLGAGFKIAMRDLEIRGAGNLLGAEQSGHIAAVGYQMYCTLLEQEARKLRHEKIVEPLKTHLELPSPPGGPGRIPPAYIPSEKHRMEAYRRISRASSLEELSQVSADLVNAYGTTPPPVRTMLDLAEVRIAASTLDIEAVKVDGPDVIFRSRHPQALDPLLRDAPGRASLIDERTVYWRPPPAYLEPQTLVAVLRKLLVRPVKSDPAATPPARAK